MPNTKEPNDNIWKIVLNAVKSVGMKHIKTNAELIVGCWYWVREKEKPNTISLLQCNSGGSPNDPWKYIGTDGTQNRIWAEDNNSQALRRWDIIGPVPVLTQEVFMRMMAPNRVLYGSKLQWESRKQVKNDLLFFTVEYKERTFMIEAINTPGLDKYDGFVDGVKIINESDFDTVEEALIKYVDKLTTM